MDAVRWERVCAAFEAARVADPADRDAILARDPGVRDEVLALLSEHEQTDAALGTVVSQAQVTAIGGYQVESLLGSGGMGSVYLGTGPLGRVALKVLHPHLALRAGFRERFAREAALGVRVAHPNVIRTLGVTDDGALIMEYGEGQTLDVLRTELGRVPEELCRHIANEVACGLQAIHDAGIVHRDLKPENVLITPEHDVKLMDFGVAFPLDDLVRLSQTGQFVGTIRYCAPEQVDGGDTPLDGRTDLYALGLVLYELATGQHPVAAGAVPAMLLAQSTANFRRLGEINPQCSAFFEELVHTLLRKAPDDRVASADALARILSDGEAGAWWSERAQLVERETKQSLRRIRIPRDTAVYGRDDELARIESLFEEASCGDGRVLLVVGEAGIGKTRLIDEAAARIQLNYPEVGFLFGSHPLGAAELGASALREALCNYLGRADLETRLANILTDTPTLVPAYAAFLRGDTPPVGTAPISGGHLHTALLATVASLSARQPLVLVVDDLHFAPKDGSDLFAALAGMVPKHNLLLIGTSRPTADAAWRADVERLDHASTMALERLGPKELSALLVDAFRSRNLAEQLGFRIAERSDGNPHFVFEIVRALKESGRVVPAEDGSWTTAGAFHEVEVPASVRDVIRARLESIEEDEREILDVAACIGATFEPKLVAQALDRKLIPVLRALARLERSKRLVRAAGPQFVFDHHQVQEAIYEALPEALREAYHAAIGEALTERCGDCLATGDEAMQICMHLAMGSRFEPALEYVAAVYEHAWKRNLWDVAISIYRRMLTDYEFVVGAHRVRVLTHLAECLETEGFRKNRGEILQEAITIGETCGDKMVYGRALSAWGWFLMNVMRLEEATVAYEGVGRIGKELGYKRGETSAFGNLAIVLSHRGEWRRATEQILQYQRIVHELDDQYGISSAYGLLGSFHFHLRDFDESEKNLRAHIKICREQSDHRGELMSTTTLGYMSSERGDCEGAFEHARRAMQMGREARDRPMETQATIAFATSLYDAGHWDDAQARAEQALEMAREVDDAQTLASCAGEVAMLRVAFGEADSAEALLDEAMERLSDAQETVYYASAVLGGAVFHHARGDYDKALAMYADAAKRHSAMPDRVALALVGQAEIYEVQDDLARAAGLFREARECAEAGRHASLQVCALAGVHRTTADVRLPEAVDLFEATHAHMPWIQRFRAVLAISQTSDTTAWDERAAAVAAECLDRLSPERRTLALAHHHLLRQLEG